MPAEPVYGTQNFWHVHESALRVHLVIGPVGAGKSTLALRLAREHSAVRLTLDEWMATLFSPDRPNDGVMEWYVERAARSVEQIWNVARAILAHRTAVVLEVGLIRRSEREQFYALVDESGFDLTLHVVDAPRDLRRERVNERNRARGTTFSMVVPPAVFELASDLWEAPDSVELEGRDVRFVTWSRPHDEASI
jgi:predicted kinase